MGTIEAPRLRAEEFLDGVAVETADWYATPLGKAVAERSPTPAAVGTDVVLVGHDVLRLSA